MKRDCAKGPAYLLERDEPDKLESKPMMGIVKDWFDGAQGPFDEYDDEAVLRELKAEVAHHPRMLQDVHELHKCGIVVRDIKGD
jgi:hypothetical protein